MSLISISNPLTVHWQRLYTSLFSTMQKNRFIVKKFSSKIKISQLDIKSVIYGQAPNKTTIKWLQDQKSLEFRINFYSYTHGIKNEAKFKTFHRTFQMRFFFSKIGIVWGTDFVKNFPTLKKVGHPCHTQTSDCQGSLLSK